MFSNLSVVTDKGKILPILVKTIGITISFYVENFTKE